MKHTIISWDCSFRNFFHLIDGLLAQNYPRDQFELIYVEQRTREYADAYNHRLGLKSLWDRYEEVKDRMNIRVIYLNDPPDVPDLVGKCHNAGISQARGDIISTMDGDLLLPEHFLTNLTTFHERQVRVVNLVRFMCKYPVGVRSYGDWTKASIDFHRCLNACGVKDKNIRIPRTYGNKGPLISARGEFWDIIGGYDTHVVWSGSISRTGGDVNSRLELATQTESLALPDTYAVHPWHPIGYARTARNKHDPLVRNYLALQQKLTDWSVQNEAPHWKERTEFANSLYEENRELFRTRIQMELQFSQAEYDDFLRNKSTIPVMLEFKLRNFPGQRLYPVRLLVKAATKVVSFMQSERDLYRPFG